MNQYAVLGVQIPNNQALTGVIDLSSYSLVAIEMPETFNATTITFQAKAHNINSDHPGVGDPNPEDWDDVYDSAGNELAITVAGNRVITDIPELGPLRYIRLRAGTSAAPANQSPAKDFNLIVKES